MDGMGLGFANTRTLYIESPRHKDMDARGCGCARGSTNVRQQLLCCSGVRFSDKIAKGQEPKIAPSRSGTERRAR